MIKFSETKIFYRRNCWSTENLANLWLMFLFVIFFLQTINVNKLCLNYGFLNCSNIMLITIFFGKMFMNLHKRCWFLV